MTGSWERKAGKLCRIGSPNMAQLSRTFRNGAPALSREILSALHTDQSRLSLGKAFFIIIGNSNFRLYG